MKRLFSITFMILALAFTASSVSCSTDEPVQETERPVSPEQPDGGDSSEEPDQPDEDDNNESNPMSNNLKITVGAVSFDATLEDNPATKAFKALLPVTVEMSEMNGNEKYYYLSGSLPTAPAKPGTIQVGDLMLYGSSCVVLFYETFSTSYSYTRLGRVSNPSGLASVLGSGSVTVTLELQNQ